MQVIRATPFELGMLDISFRPPALSMLVVVKATFELVHDRAATIAGEQEPLSGPVHEDDDVERSLVYESDFAPLKPKGEYAIRGACHPPRGPTPLCPVSFAIGGMKKSLAVYGDRHWKRGVLGKQISEPEPFERMPLTWERAFGGPGFAANPIGRGLVPEADGTHRLPNIEDPSAPITSPSDRPKPAVVGPMPPTWKSRLALAGTYDQAWLEERFPEFAADLDPSYFLASPPDQRARRHFTGQEKIEVRNLVPGRPKIESRLPGLRARAFVLRKEAAGGRFEEVPLALDTLNIDGDTGRVFALFRGFVSIADAKRSDVERLFVMHEPVEVRSPVAVCRDRMEAWLRLRRLEESGFAPLNPADDDDAATMHLFAMHRESLLTDPRMARLVERTMIEMGPGAKAPPRMMGRLLAADELPVDPTRVDIPPAGGADGDAISEAFSDAGRELPPKLARLIGAAAAWVETSSAKARLDYAERGRLRGDLTGADLSGETLTDLVADGALLTGAAFAGCDLSGASFRRSVLAGADLSRANLRGADLRGADLTDAKLVESNLSDARLEGAILTRAQLGEANLGRAVLRRACLAEANLAGACLDHADFERASLVRAILEGASAKGARFAQARLGGARAAGVDLEGADLTKIRAYDGADFEGANLREAKGERSRWRSARLDGARFDGIELGRADFSGASLEGAVLSRCRMRKAKFKGANLAGASLLEADLMRANLSGANLRGADLRGASLFAAELFRACLTDAKTEGAILAGTKLVRLT